MLLLAAVQKEARRGNVVDREVASVVVEVVEVDVEDSKKNLENPMSNLAIFHMFGVLSILLHHAVSCIVQERKSTALRRLYSQRNRIPLFTKCVRAHFI